MTDRELLELVAGEIKEMKSDLKIVKTQQSEHKQMIHL
jgi:hypothetical protein